MASLWLRLKRRLVGFPLRTEEGERERLNNLQALAILSSDALSSTAYATEEILAVLALAGASALPLSLPIAIAIILLILVVTLSYRQTIAAYPGGGGSYTVASENLGRWPGLTAAAALLIDYVLTAAVSTAAGVAAITSAVPVLYEHRVGLGLLVLAAVALINLRGIRESGAIFAIPTYAFILSLLLLIGVGLSPLLRHPEAWQKAPVPALPVREPLSLFLLLRAFASGTTALTGIEAISNGVLVFRPPEARNAQRVLLWMALTLGVLFAGVTMLAHLYGAVPQPHETVVSQTARRVFGSHSPLYYLVQAATAVILILAANTSFADFPRLASLLARDRYLPRQFAQLGDRLVFSNGILVLTFLASLLIVLFHGSTHALIPLYAVGVFLSFTLSQLGMMQHWRRLRTPGWRRRALINGLGALTTGVVLLVIGSTKFLAGAWAVLLLIPLLVLMFRKINRHYEAMGQALRIDPEVVPHGPPRPVRHVVIVPVSGVSRSVLATLRYACTISSHVKAVYVGFFPEDEAKIRQRWASLGWDVELVVLHSPYRAVLGPLVRFIQAERRRVQAEDPDGLVTVLIPEFILTRWWHYLLHNQTALRLRTVLLFQRGIVVGTVPYQLSL